MNIARISLTSSLMFTVLLGTLPIATFGQTITNAAELQQYYINGGTPGGMTPIYSGIPTTAPTTTTTTTSTPVATSAVKIETIVYQKNVIPTASAPVAAPRPVAETSVVVGDSITVSLTSQRDPATPIDLFVLAFDASGFPTKKLFIKTVFNEEKGVLKKYRVSITQDLLTELQNAFSMRVGYCLGGCLSNPARLIPGRVLLPTITPTQPGTSQTF